MTQSAEKPIIFVCATSYHPFIGGAEIAIQEVAGRLTSSFHFVVLTSRMRQNLPRKEIRPEGTVIRLGLGAPADKWLLPFLIVFYMLWKLNTGYWRSAKTRMVPWGMDISHGSLGAAFLHFFFPRVPFVFTLQYGGGEERVKKGRGGFLNFAFRRMLARSDAVTAISSYLGGLASAYGYRGKIKIIHNGVDSKKFQAPVPDSIGDKLRVRRNKVIITTSRLAHKNGIDILIAAIARVKEKIPDIECVIIGDGPEKKNLELCIAHYELQNTVKLLGSVPYEEIPKYLWNADLFVRPSRSEGMGNSFVEALAAGLPIIGTPIEGVLDIIEDGKTGLFARVDDPEDIARKILHMFEHPEHARKMAEAGRKKIQEKFSWDNIAGQYREVFQHAAQRRVLVATGLFPPRTGGPATYSALLLEELPRHGVDVTIADFGRLLRLPKIIRHCAYFFLLLKKGRYCDILFAQDPVSTGVPAAIAAIILQKPFVLKIVGDYAWEQSVQRFGVSDLLEDFLEKKYGWRAELLKKLERWCGRRARVILVPSRYLKKIVARWGILENRIVVIYNSFDASAITLFSHKEARKTLNLAGTVFISAGRLVPWKGFEMLIQAMARAREKIPDLKCLIIGDGPERKNLELQIAHCKLRDAVTLLGAVAHDRLLLYFRAGDVFVLNTGYEGFSHTILEAMASGIPVITTPAGGNPELIEHKKTGLLGEYNREAAFLKAIETLFSFSEGERRGIIRNAQRKAREFTCDRMIQETAQLLISNSQ